MAHITVVGLGPGAPESLTRAAWDTLSQAEAVWLRTARHPVVPYLPQGAVIHSFDALYEEADSFEAVYAAIVARVLELGARQEGVVYAVPGHPLVGEATVTRILQAARAAAIPVHIVPGLSFIEPTLTALALDPLDGLQIVDALDLVGAHYPTLNPDMPALIAQVYSRAVASDLKLALMEAYPDEHHVALVHAAGTSAEQVLWGPLYEIDHGDATPLTSLYVPPLPTISGFEQLQETVAHLRSPDGCPWDREQTHASLRATLLEETYEVLEAIDTEDIDALREELGDLLLQVVMHAQIAGEEGEFRMADVIAGIDAKLKHRHPHVWGNVQVADAQEVTVNWELIKRQERADSGAAQRSLLDGIPKTLPALAQACAYSGRAARVGLDWASPADILARIKRLVETLCAASSPEVQAQALGELLLALSAWARRMALDPEGILREANARFARRVRDVETLARHRGLTLEALSAEERARLWEEAARSISG
ncbi:MAG TPA: nucleoside triphosphate pyrophosphohydrolase [Anaerolineae bacterium]|nr:nucleoside triphosphate pyrophosphohydrolase [Anaerolineae bacterium]HQK13524.1 nucleoside triphosphate pyrophosphohydrolase [Anaerolineae bacterium]